MCRVFSIFNASRCTTFGIRLLIDFTCGQNPFAICNLAMLTFMSTSANFRLSCIQIHKYTHRQRHLLPTLPDRPHKSLALKSAAGDVSVSVCWPLGQTKEPEKERSQPPTPYRAYMFVGLLCLLCWHFYWPGSSAANIYKIVSQKFSPFPTTTRTLSQARTDCQPVCLAGNFYCLFVLYFLRTICRLWASDCRADWVWTWALCLNGAPSIR